MGEDWRDRARKEQACYVQLQGENPWRNIKFGNWPDLMKKIGFIRFGPAREPESEANEHTGYPRAKLTEIKQTCKLLTEPFPFEKEGISLSFIFIVARIDDENIAFPVFKAKTLKARPDSAIFVDLWNRRYRSWNHYLECEKLPECTYCAPVGGIYSVNAEGDLNLTFRQSIGTPLTLKVLDYLGVASLVLAFGSMGASVLRWPKPAMYLNYASKAAGVAALSRSVYVLAERKMHGQSLFDYGAREEWLKIWGYCLVFAGPSLRSSIGLAAARTLNGKTQPGAEHDPLNTAQLKTMRELFPGAIPLPEK